MSDEEESAIVPTSNEEDVSKRSGVRWLNQDPSCTLAHCRTSIKEMSIKALSGIKKTAYIRSELAEQHNVQFGIC